ncbi:hypothetical protein Tco_0550761, partial [Tanacetum coccineum]
GLTRWQEECSEVRVEFLSGVSGFEISPRSQSNRAGGKNQLIKAVQSSSQDAIIPSFSSSIYIFASPVSDKGNIISQTASFSVATCGYGDCRTRSRGDNIVSCPHGLIIRISHGTVEFNKVEKEWELGDIKDGWIDLFWIFRTFVPSFEWNSFISSKSSV